MRRQPDTLLRDPDRLADMAAQARKLGRPEAAEFIVDDCYQLLEG